MSHQPGGENKKSPADLAKSPWQFAACTSYLWTGETPLRSEAVQLGWGGRAVASARGWVWDQLMWAWAVAGMGALSSPKHVMRVSDFSSIWPHVFPFFPSNLFQIFHLPSLGHLFFLLADPVLIFLLKAKAKYQQDLQDCTGNTGLLGPGPMDKVALSAWENLEKW